MLLVHITFGEEHCVIMHSGKEGLADSYNRMTFLWFVESLTTHV